MLSFGYPSRTSHRIFNAENGQFAQIIEKLLKFTYITTRFWPANLQWFSSSRSNLISLFHNDWMFSGLFVSLAKVMFADTPGQLVLSISRLLGSKFVDLFSRNEEEPLLDTITESICDGARELVLGRRCSVGDDTRWEMMMMKICLISSLDQQKIRFPSFWFWNWLMF